MDLYSIKLDNFMEFVEERFWKLMKKLVTLSVLMTLPKHHATD